MNQHPLYGRLIPACTLILATAVTGCAITQGRAYDQKNLMLIDVGHSSKVHVLSLLGQPQTEETLTYKKDANGEELAQPLIAQVLRYNYGSPSIQGAVPGMSPNRWASVIMTDGAVVAYFSSSTFIDDFSDFDLGKVNQLERGKTRYQEVLKLLGRPSGRGVYPYARNPAGFAYFYSVDLKNTPPGNNTLKRLRVFFDDQGVVEDFTVSSRTEPIPVPLAPTTVTVPVYIPSNNRIK